MKVTLLQYTQNGEQLAAAAAKLCYSSSSISDVMDRLDDEATSSFLNMLTELGHESPLEHVSFTFGIEGVSRSLLAQLTRHRIASYSVKSQRYVREGNFEYVIPPEIEGEEEAVKIFISSMERVREEYDSLTEILTKRHYKALLESGAEERAAKTAAAKKAQEDARYVLPNACTTQLIATFNTRSLYNFFNHRLCERAQWEIRELAEKMLFEVKKATPLLFKKAGPPCAFGQCPEGKMSCGKMLEKRKLFREEK